MMTEDNDPILPDAVSADTPLGDESQLTPEGEALVGEFRRFLATACADFSSDEPPSNHPEVGLYQVFEALTAQRQEFKTLAKTSRKMLDASEDFANRIQLQIQRLRITQSNESGADSHDHELLAIALSELMNVDEALERLAQVSEKFVHQVETESFRSTNEENLKHLSTYDRFFHGSFLRRFLADSSATSFPESFKTFDEGVQMTRTRIDGALSRLGISRIDQTGVPVDPNFMTVIELTDIPGRPTGEVAQIIRAGYRMGPRVLRYAEVIAVR